MKITLKVLLLGTLIAQQASAVTTQEILKHKFTLATGCAVMGYVVSNFLDINLKNIISDKNFNTTDTTNEVKNKTKFNENMKALREAIQVSGPALIEAQLHQYKYGSPVNTYLLINAFNFWQSLTEVTKKLTSWCQSPSVDSKEMCKTAVYVLAGVSQTIVPNLIEDQRLKPFAKYFTRSILNKALEAMFLGGTTDLTNENLSNKKSNEAFKDLVDFGINGGLLVKTLFV